MTESMMRRPRRNRKSQAVRDMVEETQVAVNDLIFPIFLIDGNNKKNGGSIDARNFPAIA